MIRLILEAVKEWVESLLKSYAEKKDIVVYCPDDKGAKGDGVTIDDDAFLEGNYCYQLTKGKTYRITRNKLFAIANNSVVGSGVIRFISPNSWENQPYGMNTIVLPTYGANTYELSARKPQNRLEECIEYFSNEDCFESVPRHNRRIKIQAVKPPSDSSGTYHNIGAIYYRYDTVDSLPEQFTICIGRSATFQNKDGSNEWVKVIDEYIDKPIELTGNYRLPWKTEDGQRRRFNHTPVFVGDHTEIVVDKKEMLSWLGTEVEGTEGCVHFWGHNHNFKAGEFDNLVNYWEIWVKEPEASEKLMFSIGVDCYSDSSSSTTFFNQIIFGSTIPITSKPQSFWGCTMNVDGARALKFEDLATQLYQKNIGDIVSGSGRNFNMLGLNAFEPTTKNIYTLQYNNDVFTLSAIDGDNAYTSFSLTNYLIDMPTIKSGDVFRVNIEVLDNINNLYLGDLQYANGKSVSLQLRNENRVKRYIYSIRHVAQADANRIILGTNSTAINPQITFRMWITKGEEYHDYQKYGKAVDGYVLKDNVIDKYLDDKITAIENELSSDIDFTTLLGGDN